MDYQDLKETYSPGKNAKSTKLVTLAVRAEIPGGEELVAINTLLHESLYGRKHLRPVIDLVYDDVDSAYAMMRAEISRRYNLKMAAVLYQPDRPAPALGIIGHMPTWCAWHRLAELDTRTLTSEQYDFAEELKQRLQAVLREMTAPPNQ